MLELPHTMKGVTNAEYSLRWHGCPCRELHIRVLRGKQRHICPESGKDADWKSVVKYLEKIQKNRPGEDLHFVCGYEAGCLGYSLYYELLKAETFVSLDCIIMAPTTMAVQGNKTKTDRRDACMIARNLAYGTYSRVYVVDDEDNGVKDFIRMRDDTKTRCKSIKQQLLALCLRHGKRYSEGINWTARHREWLRKQDLGEKNSNKALQEYLHQLSQAEEDLERYDREKSR